MSDIEHFLEGGGAGVTDLRREMMMRYKPAGLKTIAGMFDSIYRRHPVKTALHVRCWSRVMAIEGGRAMSGLWLVNIALPQRLQRSNAR